MEGGRKNLACSELTPAAATTRSDVFPLPSRRSPRTRNYHFSNRRARDDKNSGQVSLIHTRTTFC